MFYYQELVEFEKKKIENNFIFFIYAFLYISIRLLIVPFFILLVNSFEEPNFTVTKYAFTSSFIIVIYCFIKTYSYTYEIPSIINQSIKEKKQKLKKKPNG
jgi:pilus assembly protein TadC